MGRTSPRKGISESSSLFSTLLFFFLFLLLVIRPVIQVSYICSIPVLSLSPFFNPLSLATVIYVSFPADTHALSSVLVFFPEAASSSFNFCQSCLTSPNNPSLRFSNCRLPTCLGQYQFTEIPSIQVTMMPHICLSSAEIC